MTVAGESLGTTSIPLSFLTGTPVLRENMMTFCLSYYRRTVATLELQSFDQVQQHSVGGLRSRLNVLEQQLFG